MGQQLHPTWGKDMTDDNTTGPDTQGSDQNSTSSGTDQTNSAASDTDLAAEVEKWKTLSRKHEDQAKANKSAASELTKLKQSQMTDQDKAIELAVQEAVSQTKKTFATRLVDAEIRNAATGRNLNVDALLRGLDRTGFVSDDGEPDTDAVKKYLDELAPITDPSKPNPGQTRTDMGQGHRGTNSPKSKGSVFDDFINQNF